MTSSTLVRLAQDLEWLGCELEHVGRQHAVEGFPESGPAWERFLDIQQGVKATANKIERELKKSVRFNPTTLVGVEYSLAANLDSIGEMLGSLEDIKQCAEFSVQDLPSKVRSFSKTVSEYLDDGDGAGR